MKRLFLLLGLLLVALPAHGQTSGVWVEDLTWPEVRDAIASGKRTAIIYVGSTEQNGPHMVLGNTISSPEHWLSESPSSSATR
jgi:hypothetical protein